MKPDLWIWVTGWEVFQTFHKKHGKAWTPPWIKTYVAQLYDHRYLDLTDRQRALLHDLRMMQSTTLGRIPHDTRTISRHRHRQTRDADLLSLYHAGLIDICSRTVLEQRRAAFWNRSKIEVEVEVEVEEPGLLGGLDHSQQHRFNNLDQELKRLATEELF